MNTQHPDGDKKDGERRDPAADLPPVSGLNRQQIETLWGESIRGGVDATRTIKVAARRRKMRTFCFLLCH